MKTYKITNRLSAKARKVIENCIEQHEKYKKAYFFTPARNAAGRRSNEERVAKAHPAFKLVDGDNVITVEPLYNESCKNVYYSLDITVNGDLKDIRVLKKIIK